LSGRVAATDTEQRPLTLEPASSPWSPTAGRESAEEAVGNLVTEDAIAIGSYLLAQNARHRARGGSLGPAGRQLCLTVPASGAGPPTNDDDGGDQTPGLQRQGDAAVHVVARANYEPSRPSSPDSSNGCQVVAAGGSSSLFGRSSPATLAAASACMPWTT